jgi:hypothetical protein
MDSGKDKSFTQKLANVLPGWHGKDIHDEDTYDAKGKNTNGTKLGTTHRGRDGVLEINPINDVLPAKLIATIEVPQKSQAALVFEVSSKDAVHEWLLSASIANLPLLQKVPIKTRPPQEWLEVPLNLAIWSGKRVEVVLEIAMRPKTLSQVYKEQVGYLRNIRLEWPGKPQAAKPQTPVLEPKPQQPAEGTKEPQPAAEPKQEQ